MTIFKYDPNNTEGAYPTAMVVEGAELKKGDKIVATDIVDLYDTDINSPTEGQALVYATDVWINGEGGGGGGCNIFNGYTGSYDDITDIETLSANYYSTLVIKSDGTMWGTGRNYYGEIGLGHKDPIEAFLKVGSDTDWVKVACGQRHTMAIKSDGTLWATGDGYYGRTGFGSYIDVEVFTQVGTDTDWDDVSCGTNHSMAIKTGGTLWATGDNAYGQLGTGNNTDSSVFIQIGVATNWSVIKCGILFTMVLNDAGELWGTGRNIYGQLGINSTSSVKVLTQENNLYSDWIDFACGLEYSIGIRSGGTLWGAGNNLNGQMGLGAASNYNSVFVREVLNHTNWQQVSCGYKHTIAIKTDGTIYGCGENDDGQLGLGDGVLYVDQLTFVQELSTGVDWDTCYCGSYNTFSIKTDKNLYGCGEDVYNNLGLPYDTYSEFTPIPFTIFYTYAVFIDENTSSTERDGTPEDPFISLSETFTWLRNTCVVIPEDITLTVSLLSDLNISEETSINHPYGHRITINSSGYTIINDSTIDITTGIVDENFINNTSVFCGAAHSFLINDNNYLHSTGFNFYGQLCLGHESNRDIFSLVDGLYPNIIYGRCGESHTMVIKSDGTLWVAGYNNNGGLGLGDNDDRDELTQVGTGTDWDIVDGGFGHTMAIKDDGGGNRTLWSTGYNFYGQLGLGNSGTGTDRNTFIQVGSDTDWAKVFCGSHHSIAIKTNGTLWVAGYNINGQLGLGDNTNRSTFIQVGTGTDWDIVDGGNYHSVAIKDDGASNRTLWSTGRNSDGQLGLGDNTNRSTFIQVGTDTDWEQVSTGYYHTVVIKSGGTIWGTGFNMFGQLGLSDNSNRNTFIQVGTDTDWVSVSSGQYHTIAIKDNSSELNILSTGYNAQGQLGLDDNANRNEFTYITYEKSALSSIDSDGFKIKLYNNCINIEYTDFDIDLTYTTYPFTIIGDVIYIDGNPITDYIYNEYELRVNNIDAENNSCTDIDSCNILNDTEIIIEELNAGIEYAVIYIYKTPIKLINSLGIFENIIPSNIAVDISGTIEVPDLQYDIVNWEAKNNSLVNISTSISPTIDITNENSTVIKNDVII